MGTDGSGDPPHVLVVEDDPATVQLYDEAFHDLADSVTVSVATDGDEALALLSGELDAGLPDVVVLDLDLPGTDGRDVLRELRDADGLAALPVVVISGRSDQATIDECYRLGASAYVVKPDDYDGLLDVVRQVSTFWARDEVRYPSTVRDE